MPFPQGPVRGFPTVRLRASVFAVGCRAYVFSPGDRQAPLQLTNQAGISCGVSLAAGTAVDIVAWRPRAPGEIRYRVRSSADGVEGWLMSGALRTTHPDLPLRTAASAAVTSS
jgi:hypothetical protein